MEYLILAFVVVAVAIIMFGLVMAIDLNKLINKNCSEGNTIKGEKS